MGTKLKFVGKRSIEAGKQLSSHVHSCVEIIMYLNADGKIKINGKNHAIKSGNIAFVSANSQHGEHHNEKCKAIYFGFETDDINIAKEGVYTNVTGFETLQNIAERIYTEFNNQDEEYELIAAAKIVEFIVLFGRHISNASKPDRSLDHCADHFRQNFASQINIKEVVEGYGFDYERFRKEFKQKYGLAPKQYIIELRLNHAYNMICNGGVSCTDVAMYCGFSDGSQFSKMFKKRYGITPDKVRPRTNLVTVTE